MVREVQVIAPERTIKESRTRIDHVLDDRYPSIISPDWSKPSLAVEVVDESRAWLPNPRGRRSEPRVIDANDPDSVLQDAQPGFSVLASDGMRVGTVDRIGYDRLGRRESIVVVYGRLSKRRKAIDGALVDLVDDGVVMLSIDSAAFKMMRDV